MTVSPIERFTVPCRLERESRRDSNMVSPVELAEYIKLLEGACSEDPSSADLRTCLGMAYSMNGKPIEAIDSLEHATHLDRTHFFARFKLSEVYLRLKALSRAEEETRRALALARNRWEVSMAKRQLTAIQRMHREQTRGGRRWLRRVSAIGFGLLAGAMLTMLIWK